MNKQRENKESYKVNSWKRYDRHGQLEWKKQNIAFNTVIWMRSISQLMLSCMVLLTLSRDSICGMLDDSTTDGNHQCWLYCFLVVELSIGGAKWSKNKSIDTKQRIMRGTVKVMELVRPLTKMSLCRLSMGRWEAEKATFELARWTSEIQD